MTVSNILEAKRRRKYQKAFASAGWNIHVKSRELSGDKDPLEHGPLIYICDIKTGYMQVTAGITHAFEVAADLTKKHGFTFDMICNSLGSILQDLSQKKIKLDDSASDLLAFLAFAYISGTEGYKLTKRMGTSMHFLIINYLNHATGENMLRPVPISPEKCHSPEVIEGVINDVLYIDRMNHPERFQSATIIPFKIKTISGLDKKNDRKDL